MKKVLAILTLMVMTLTGWASTITTTAPSPTSYCVGQTISVSFTTSGVGSGFQSYQLKISPNWNSCNWNIVGAILTTSAGSGTIVYTIPVNYPTYCIGPIGSVAGSIMYVRIFGAGAIPLPSPPNSVTVYDGTPSTSISGNTTICVGMQTTLSAGVCPNYSWTPGNATTPAITVSPTTTTTYSLYSSNTCGISSSSATVIVNQPPVASIVATSSTICASTQDTLVASGGGTYSWSNSAVVATIYPAPTITTTYTVTVTDSGGCTDTATKTIVVNPLPTPVITPSGPTTICQGNSVTLMVNSYNSYSWNSSATTQSVIITTAGNYNVTVTDANGCKNTTANTNVIVQNPISNFTSSLNLPTVNFTNTSTGASTYSWDFGDASNSTGTSPSHIYATNAMYQVCLIAYSSAGCSDTTCQSIDVNTGIAEQQSVINFNMYPNPASQMATLNIPEEIRGKNVIVSVIDMSGRVVTSDRTEASETIELYLKDISSGTYMVTISTDGFYGKKLLSVIK